MILDADFEIHSLPPNITITHLTFGDYFDALPLTLTHLTYGQALISLLMPSLSHSPYIWVFFYTICQLSLISNLGIFSTIQLTPFHPLSLLIKPVTLFYTFSCFHLFFNPLLSPSYEFVFS